MSTLNLSPYTDDTINLTHDVLAFSTGTLIRINQRVKYVDRELVVMVDMPHLYTLSRLGVLTYKNKVVFDISSNVKVFANYEQVASKIPKIALRLIEKGILLPEAELYVCTKEKAAAILATLAQTKAVKMQTPYTIRSVKQ